MIEAKNLVMRFGDRIAVDGLSFSVAKGSIVGFLGPNGAGKSTTMRMLTGCLVPMAGGATICGHDIVEDRALAQARIGYLPEAANGFAGLTVREFLTFCGEARGLRGTTLDDAIARVAADVHLAEALGRRLKELSKGWRQRAWFAQALLHDPDVLILDEPTDGLDPNQKERMRAFIRRIAADKAILLSTHILEEAEEICTRAIVVANGRIVADDAPSKLADARGRLAPAFHALTDTPAETGTPR